MQEHKQEYRYKKYQHEYDIKLEKVKVFGYHGVNPEENRDGQFFYIDAHLKINKAPESLKDDINSTVSYANINKLIIKIVSEKIYKLIETLAADIAESILDSFPDVYWAKIEVSKPNAPMKGEFENISVSVIRQTQDKFDELKNYEFKNIDILKSGDNFLDNKLLFNDVFLSLGSNIGNDICDKKNNLNIAISEIKKLDKIKIFKISGFYETKPVDYENQDDFCNCCLNLKTSLSAFELLYEMQKIENKMGRTREIRFGPRIIDIDILLYNNLALQDENLVIPHVRMFERAFVLVPLLEILPRDNFYFNKTNKSLLEILKIKSVI